MGYPGQEMIEKIVHWLRHPFRSSDDERQRLLSPDSLDISPVSPDGADDSPSSSDETPSPPRRKSYGTMGSPTAPPPPPTRIQESSFFTTLNPFSDVTSITTRRRSSQRYHHIDPFTAELKRQFYAREASKLRTCLTSLAASVAILVVVFVLAATGRRKQIGTVDEGIVFGVVASLLFAMVGAGYMLSLSWGGWEGEDEGKRLVRKWTLRMAIGLLFVGVSVANGSLIAFMIA